MNIDDLEKLWQKLSFVPVDEEDQIAEDFLHFEAGTPVFDVWAWFESQNNDFSVGCKLSGAGES